MAVTLNRRAYEHARKLISEGRVLLDDRDAWSEHRPSAHKENDFIRLHGFSEYGKWYLGINDKKSEQTKGPYAPGRPTAAKSGSAPNAGAKVNSPPPAAGNLHSGQPILPHRRMSGRAIGPFQPADNQSNIGSLAMAPIDGFEEYSHRVITFNRSDRVGRLNIGHD
jgi:hypothetical protein